VHHLPSRSQAEWGARGVRVNAVRRLISQPPSSAFVKTARRCTMLDRGYADGPDGGGEEIASVVLFLASDAASLMTGSIVSSKAAIRAGELG